MAKILIIAGNVPAIVSVNLALAKKLQQAGHTVQFASGANVKNRAGVLNLPFFKLNKKPDSFLGKRRFFGSPGRQQAVDEAIKKIENPRLSELLHTFQPDFTLIDCEQHALVLYLHTQNVPFGLLSNWFTYQKHPSLPPLHNVAIPGRGWRGSRPMIDLLWRKFWLTTRIRNAKAWLRHGGLNRLTVYRAYAERLGIRFSDVAEPYMWLLPYSHKATPMFTSVNQALDLPHQKPADFNYLGPILDLERPEPAAQADEIEQIESILASPAIQSKAQKLIYASTSSIFEPDTPFFKKLIGAIAHRPDWTLILALGKKMKKDELGQLPPNIHAFNWVPQLRVLEFADVAVTHAGINTVNECLYFGVPMLAYSGGHIDQNGTAARIGYHNLGIVGSKSADGSADIQAHIDHILADDSIHAAVAKMSQIVRNDQANKTAVKTIESWIAELGEAV